MEALVHEPLVRPAALADVGVVVVMHNSASVIDECLMSLSDVRSTAQVVVVDNASSDGSAELVASRHPGVTLLRKRRRSGFATNCNIGVAATHARHVLLLNPDTAVRRGAVDALVAYLDSEPTVGIVAPRLVYRDGSPQPSARAFPTVATALVRRTPLRSLLPNSALERRYLQQGTDVDLSAARDIDWALGAVLAIRGEAWIDLGGLDDGYRLYCEDADVCWRAHKAGWAVRYLPQAVVAHDLSEHTRKHFFTVRTAWHLRSLVRFARKNGLRPPVGSPSAEGSR
ncbi:MAG: glycosyltransferase family 2 protein [Actinomycetota bacterium]